MTRPNFDGGRGQAKGKGRRLDWEVGHPIGQL